MSDLPRGTVTFLFTDIEGSTRLWQQHPQAMERAYARHDAILRDAATHEQGVVYKTIGDAFQVAFPTAPGALAAALQAQLGLRWEEWASLELPEPVRVRMALHTGAVDPDPDGDYRSPVLNRLGRLLSAGHGGRVLLSQATQELVRDRLPAGVTLRDLGEQRLKDLFRPEHVYQLLAPRLEDTFPPLRTLDARPNNLPLQPTPFIGRERLVAEVRSLLARSDVRLLTLTGPGGMGKTRLSLQVAADMLDDFADGVFFVPLATVSDPGLVVSTIAEVLGIREEGSTPLLTTLGSMLRDKQMLLVLDNFEQVVAAASRIGELLTMCPRLKVLITSRIPLRLQAEHQVQVRPMPLPMRFPPPTAGQLNQFESVRLLIARGQAVKQDFVITNANAPAVAEICHRLDGLPLAIELAAARIRLLPPQAMLARLQSRLPLLTGGARDLPERQRTLRGAIAWSHELLSPDEQALFRRLAVFAGGFMIAAAEAVVAGDDPGLDMLDGLERLVDHSLVRQEEGPEGEPWFSMLETIREYGLEQLEGSGEADDVRRRHVLFYLALTEEAETALMAGQAQGAWLRRLETELDNVRAAIGWVMHRDPEVALRIAGVLAPFWTMRGHLSEGRSWVERALAAAGGAAATVRVKAIHAAGLLADSQGDFTAARAQFEEMLALARQVGATSSVTLALNNLGILTVRNGDMARAGRLWEEARTLAREAGDDRQVANISNNLGILLAQQGDLTGAETLMTEGLVLDRAQGDARGLVYSLVDLGQLALARGRTGHALALVTEGLLLAREIGLRASIVGEGVVTIGGAAAQVGQLAHAVRLFGAAQGGVESLGSFLDLVLPAEHERVVSAVRGALGDAAFTAAWEAGGALTFEETVAEALVVAEAISGDLPAGSGVHQRVADDGTEVRDF